MENSKGQELADWQPSSTQVHEKDFLSSSYTESGLLDETLEVVKEKVWSFKRVWKSFAEAFCRYGISPTIAGYSTVPNYEDDYIKEHSADELALAKVDADGGKSSLSPASHHLRGSSGEALPEEGSLLLTEDDPEDDVNHPFADSAERDSVEQTSLTGSKKLRDGAK